MCAKKKREESKRNKVDTIRESTKQSLFETNARGGSSSQTREVKIYKLSAGATSEASRWGGGKNGDERKSRTGSSKPSKHGTGGKGPAST